VAIRRPSGLFIVSVEKKNEFIATRNEAR